jgi:hypothetical protein
MTVQVTGKHAYVERLVTVVKIVTVIEACYTEEQRSVLRLSWAKENSKDILKEICPV